MTMDLTENRMQSLGDFLGHCFKRLFSESRTMARIKMLTFASFLTFLGLGVALKFTGANATLGTIGPVEFVLSSPDVIQSIGALVALLFILATNIYTRLRRQEYEKNLFALAADPNTPQDVRSAILEKLRS